MPSISLIYIMKAALPFHVEAAMFKCGPCLSSHLTGWMAGTLHNIQNSISMVEQYAEKTI